MWAEYCQFQFHPKDKAKKHEKSKSLTVDPRTCKLKLANAYCTNSILKNSETDFGAFVACVGAGWRPFFISLSFWVH
ncbi:hypothetical protein I656_03806 [Geobacillus sp. WSUCF1]|nr:hypothetical protein I656_03806 [Geobacillus sp. WSUCF1]